jgi:hypothetical protein
MAAVDHYKMDHVNWCTRIAGFISNFIYKPGKEEIHSQLWRRQQSTNLCSRNDFSMIGMIKLRPSLIDP